MTAFAEYLPYWTTRTFGTDDGPVSVLILADGTFVVGLDVTGVDMTALEPTTVVQNQQRLRGAMNHLPDGFFVQWEWRTGISNADIVDDYARRGRRGHPLVTEQRARRADFFARDESLRRGRLVAWVGKKQALGSLEGGLLFSLIALIKRQPIRSRSAIRREDIQPAVEELQEVISLFVGELKATGAVVAKMDEAEILTELHEVLNPVSSKSTAPPRICDDPKLFSDDDLRDKTGVFRPYTLREQLALGDFEQEIEHYLLDDPPLYHRALTMQRLPETTHPQMCLQLQHATSYPYRLSVCFDATNRQASTEKIKWQEKRMHSQAVTQAGPADRQAGVALEEYAELLQTMIQRDERVFKMSYTITVSAPTIKELDRATIELKTAFSQTQSVITTATGAQLYAATAALPANGYATGRMLGVTTTNAADFIPIFQPSAGDDEAEFVSHTRYDTLTKISMSSANRINRNNIMLGSSGAGKSFTVSNFLEQCVLAEGAPVLVVDVQGPAVSNYKVLAEVLGGRYTPIGHADDVAFNPFYAHNAITKLDGVTGKKRVDEDKVQNLCRLIRLMSLPNDLHRDSQDFANEIARHAILQAYRATKGKGRPPLVRDVVAQLAAYKAPNERYAALAVDMHLHLKTWTTNKTRAKLIDRHAPAPPNTLLDIYDFHGLEKDPELATVMLLSATFRIWEVLETYPKDAVKTVIFDEVWALLAHPVAASIAKELFKTARKWGASIWAVTQDLSDFVGSPASDALLANSQLLFLLKHTQNHEDVAEICNLNKKQVEIFKSLDVRPGEYSEILLVDRAKNLSTVCRLKPTPFDLWLNTSKPRDVAFRDSIQRERQLSSLEAIRFCADNHPHGAPK